MGWLLLFIWGLLSLSHWLLEPLVRGLTPLLSSTGLGWVGVALVIWLLAGAAPDEPPNHPKN